MLQTPLGTSSDSNTGLNRQFSPAHGIKPCQKGLNILSVFPHKLHKLTKVCFSIYCIHLLFAGKVGFLYILLVYLDRFRNVLLFHLLYRLAIYSKVCFQQHQKNMFFARFTAKRQCDTIDQKVGPKSIIQIGFRGLALFYLFRDVYNCIGQNKFTYEPDKKNKNITVLFGLIKGNHIYTMNDNIKSIAQNKLDEDMKLCASTDFHLNSKEKPVKYVSFFQWH